MTEKETEGNGAEKQPGMTSYCLTCEKETEGKFPGQISLSPCAECGEINWRWVEFKETRTLAEVASVTHIDRTTILAAIGREDVAARKSAGIWLMSFKGFCAWIKASKRRGHFRRTMNKAFLKKYDKFL